MKIENTEVYGFRAALRGMRNPKNSWAASDSLFYYRTGPTGRVRMRTILGVASDYELDPAHAIMCESWGDVFVAEWPIIGPKDLELAERLIGGGPEHRKFLRQIVIWVDLTLPRYVWQEMDTYKVATVRDSCSTMHKLTSQDLTTDDFEDEDVLPSLLHTINEAAKAHREGKDYGGVTGHALLRYVKKMLPEGYLQKATYTMNYETALNILHQRSTHRLPEWSGPDGICSWLRTLPHMSEFERAASPAR